MRSRTTDGRRTRRFPPTRGWRAWLERLRRGASLRRENLRERDALVAHAEFQYHRLRAQHERFLAAWRDNEIANLRRERALAAQPEAMLRSSLRRLALEGPQSGAWLPLSRARFEAGQWSAGLRAAAEAVRAGLLEPAAIASVAEGAGPTWAVGKVFRAETLSPTELGELYRTLRDWPTGLVLRRLLLRELFSRVTDHEEQVRLTEQAGLRSEDEEELEAIVRETWRELADQSAMPDAETVPAHDAWLFAAPYDWAPALAAHLPLTELQAPAPGRVRFAQRTTTFDAEVAWSRRRCRHYLLGNDPSAPQAAPRALPGLHGLHSEPWRLVGFESLAEAWPPPGRGEGERWLDELVGAARRFGDPIRRARCLYAAGAVVMPHDSRQGTVCWQQGRDILVRSLPERAARVLPAAIASCLRAAASGATAEADDELTLLMTRLRVESDAATCAQALLGALPAAPGEQRRRVVQTVAGLPTAEQPEVAFLLAYDRGDFGAMAAALCDGWVTDGEAPWLMMAFAAGRCARLGDVRALRSLGDWFAAAADAGDQPAVAVATMLTVRAEQLEGRADAPAAQPLLRRLVELQGEGLYTAVLALGACSDGAAPGWLRAVETAFLRRLEHASPTAAVSLPHFEMLLEILAQAQIEARVRQWLAEYREAVEGWTG